MDFERFDRPRSSSAGSLHSQQSQNEAFWHAAKAVFLAMGGHRVEIVMRVVCILVDTFSGGPVVYYIYYMIQKEVFFPLLMHFLHGFPLSTFMIVLEIGRLEPYAPSMPPCGCGLGCREAEPRLSEVKKLYLRTQTTSDWWIGYTWCKPFSRNETTIFPGHETVPTPSLVFQRFQQWFFGSEVIFCAMRKLAQTGLPHSWTVEGRGVRPSRWDVNKSLPNADALATAGLRLGTHMQTLRTNSHLGRRNQYLQRLSKTYIVAKFNILII